ncbi:MAG: family 14 glycosylhydrolase [Spirochaetaceae bacterium]|jgi:beta-amylase|nr:family 14 glycosylhydrolase [Spirochaetaceae bacterium]
MKKRINWIGIAGILIFTVLFLSACDMDLSAGLEDQITLSRQLAGETNTFAVMAPLHVTNWGEFEYDLNTVKAYGVQAVSVDVWWGDVEAGGDNSFNWSYYDTIFEKIRNAGLDIVPIMSFHQCGGNVGDDYTSYLPSWIWSKYSGVSPEDLKYRSETGAYSSEYISLWADQLVVEEYVDFMNAFEAHFGYMASAMAELNISGGPAGELRYPSYNSHDWGGYGNRGTLQAYGNYAKNDFKNDMISKYGSLSGVNSAWGTSLNNDYDIAPPMDANWFFNNWDYINTQYGRDFIDWYNQSLKEHGITMINAAKSAFDNQFANVEFGMKIPGVHWEISNPTYPRLAEMTAGLLKISDNYQSAASGYGYGNIINGFTGHNRQVNLHFTCLEKGNDEGDAYSKAEDLVFWVAQAALDQNVRIKGENALSDGVTNDYGWDHINNAFAYASYTGLTILRMHNVSSGTGKTRYASFIQNYGIVNPVTELTIHYKEWESATTYSIHPWDGLSGYIIMAYEGYFNNGHWWKATISSAPAGFNFCFTNSNGNWDGGTRVFSSQASEIYINPWNNTVYTYRP